MTETMLVHTTEHLRFEWRFGNYINVFNKHTDIEFDLINVWDYELDCPTIAKTPEAFVKRIEAWLAE